AQFSLEAIIVPALTLMIFTGFTEELIFRGLLQTLARQLLGVKGLVFVALLFAVLYIGYRSIPIFFAVLSFGLLAGCAVLYTQSILGVTIAHSLANIMLFLVMPYTPGNPELAAVVDRLVALGVLGGIAALATIFFSIVRSRQAIAHQRLLQQDTGSHSGLG
ncbi:MAG: CPBP family intramembrane metalloprotease, partial [Chloroflexales bacterium]|nr:CPBP family intramembrane metalloprotease [Chloroflexales bacterium]